MTGDDLSQQEFRSVIDEALALLREYDAPAALVTDTPALPLPSLLDQCRQALAESDARIPPIRLVHHLACTGGTLISRCIGAMPNTRLLSEVDPLSPLGQKMKFVPTDLIRLANFGTRPPEPELIHEIFRTGLQVLYEDCVANGLSLVLRDHSHSHFHYGGDIPPRPSLRDLVRSHYSVRAMVSVRHPLDSFLSAKKQNFLAYSDFSPLTLEEYSNRYHAFLDHYADLEPIRYEDFVSDPEHWMQRICALLDLSYDPDFRQTISAIKLSGDSGRTGAVITPRPRREMPEDMVGETRHNAAYASLCARLGYDP